MASNITLQNSKILKTVLLNNFFFGTARKNNQLFLQIHSSESNNGKTNIDWNSQILLIVAFSLENKKDVINSQLFIS